MLLLSGPGGEKKQLVVSLNRLNTHFFQLVLHIIQKCLCIILLELLLYLLYYMCFLIRIWEMGYSQALDFCYF